MCNHNIFSTTRNFIILFLLLLVGCGPLPDEGTLKRQSTSVTLNYNVDSESLRDFEMTNYSSSVQRMIETTWPIRHNIKVEPDIADIDLDWDLRAEVEVPVDEPMWIEYTNWTEDEPEIPFQYGKSDEFIVTHEDDYIVKVWVDVDIHPDYPFSEEEEEEEIAEEEEEETTDNETVEETDNETVEEEVDSTLLAHYEFEGNLEDSSSYGRDLELCSGSNQFIFIDESLMNYLPSGNAAWFQGTECAENEFRDTNGNPPISILSDFTISFWILPWLTNNPDFDEWHSVMSTVDSTSGYRFQIDHSGSHELRFMGYMKVDITEEWLFFTYTKSTGTINSNDNKKVRTYKNGVLKTYAYPLTTAFDKVKIGMNRLGGGGWYGLIDDVRIYNRALTEDEIVELYESYE